VYRSIEYLGTDENNKKELSDLAAGYLLEVRSHVTNEMLCEKSIESLRRLLEDMDVLADPDLSAEQLIKEISTVAAFLSWAA